MIFSSRCFCFALFVLPPPNYLLSYRFAWPCLLPPNVSVVSFCLFGRRESVFLPTLWQTTRRSPFSTSTRTKRLSGGVLPSASIACWYECWLRVCLLCVLVSCLYACIFLGSLSPVKPRVLRRRVGAGCTACIAPAALRPTAVGGFPGCIFASPN